MIISEIVSDTYLGKNKHHTFILSPISSNYIYIQLQQVNTTESINYYIRIVEVYLYRHKGGVCVPRQFRRVWCEPGTSRNTYQFISHTWELYLKVKTDWVNLVLGRLTDDNILILMILSITNLSMINFIFVICHVTILKQGFHA